MLVNLMIYSVTKLHKGVDAKRKVEDTPPPDSVLEDLEVLADAQGRLTGNLAAFLIEIGIKQSNRRQGISKNTKNLL